MINARASSNAAVEDQFDRVKDVITEPLCTTVTSVKLSSKKS